MCGANGEHEGVGVYGREHMRTVLAAYEPRLSGWELPGPGSGATALVGGRFHPAGVLVLLDSRTGEERMIFQRRTAHVEHHKGQISLPGGRRDEEDVSLLATALRETHEEIGVPPDAIEVLGRLDDITTGTGYAISPFVGAIVSDWSGCFRLHEAEVEQLLEVPLAHLGSERGRVRATVVLGDRPRSEEAFLFEGALIWGATGRIVHNFFEVCTSGTPDAVE